MAVFKSNLLILVFSLVVLIPLKSHSQAGSLDPSFGTNGMVLHHLDTFPDQCNALAVLSDQKIMISGTSFDSLASPFSFLARYTEDGILDPSFGTAGIQTTIIAASSHHAMSIQADGKILLGSQTGLNQCAVARYNDDGTLDTSFGLNGLVTTDVSGFYGENCQSISIQDDGKIIVGGYMNDNGPDQRYFLLIRYDANGMLDPTFGSNGIVTGGLGTGYSTRIQSDGKIIIGGKSSSKFALERYNSNGSLDTSFGNNGVVLTQVGPTSSVGKSLALDENEKIVFGGQSNVVSSGTPTTNFSVVRYNSNGDLDNSFGTGGIVITDVVDPSFSYNTKLAMILQDDFKILMAANAGYHFALVRYNSDGTLDGNFGTGGHVNTIIGENSSAKSIGLQSNGKIIVGGYYSSNSDIDIALVRYEGDGVNDLSDFKGNQNMVAYPNPLSSSTTVSFGHSVDDAKLIIFNANGDKVKVFREVYGTEKIVSIKNLPGGIYYVKLLEKEGVTAVKKIVIGR